MAKRWWIVLILFICPLLVLSFVSASDTDTLTALSPSPGSSPALNSTQPCLINGTQPSSIETGHLELRYSSFNDVWKDEYLLSRLHGSECKHLLTSTHALTVSGFGSLANFSSIASVLPLFDSLTALHWQNTGAIPGSILNVMRKNHPNYRLHYGVPLYKRDRYRTYTPAEDAEDQINDAIRNSTRQHIIGNRNLHALKADIHYGSDGDAHSMPLLHEILTTCPNLREFELSLQYNGGCTPGWPHIYAFDFSDDKIATASFPPLEVLKLRGYDLNGRLSVFNEDSRWFARPKSAFRWP